MVQTAVSRGLKGAGGKLREDLVQAFRWMLLARILDEKFAGLYRGGKIHGGVFIGRGQEALSVAIGQTLRKGDVFAPLIRDTAGRLAFGEAVLEAVRTYLGSPLGPMRGRDGNVHRGRPRDGLLPMISHLGAMISVVNGMLMAKRFRGVRDAVGAASIGEGATSTGAFHEALNQAAVEKLPLVLVVANNQYAYSTPTDRQFACASLVDRAIGYGVEGHEVAGNDLAACWEVLQVAVAKARAGGGPQLVVANLLRLCGHGEHDDAGYIRADFKKASWGRDCLLVAEEFLREREWVTQGEVEEWKQDATRNVEEVVGQVQREASPDPYAEDWCALATRRLGEGHHE